MQSFDRHCILKESAGRAGMVRTPPEKVVHLADDNRSDNRRGGLKAIQRVKEGPNTFFDHLFLEACAEQKAICAYNWWHLGDLCRDSIVRAV